MKTFEKFISKIIEDYLYDNTEIDIDEEKVFEYKEEIIDAIDVKKLSKEISEKLLDMTLQFEPTPMLDTSHSYMCPKCYRNHGVWRSNSGISLHDSVILSKDKKIIIIDDVV